MRGLAYWMALAGCNLLGVAAGIAEDHSPLLGVLVALGLWSMTTAYALFHRQPSENPTPSERMSER